MKEGLVLIVVFSSMWIEFIEYTTVRWDDLVLVLKIYQHGNQLVFTIIQADLIGMLLQTQKMIYLI